MISTKKEFFSTTYLELCEVHIHTLFFGARPRGSRRLPRTETGRRPKREKGEGGRVIEKLSSGNHEGEGK